MTLQNFTLGTFAQGAAGGGASFESIATATGTGSSSTITFSSIPSTYQHLQIRYIAKTTGTTSALYNLLTQFNSDTASNYTRHELAGDGATATAAGSASQTSIRVSSVLPNSGSGLANMHGVGIIDILDYTSTSKNKTVRYFCAVDTNSSTSPTGNLSVSSGLWFATPAAINSITLTSATNNFTTTSTFALYGIKGA